MEINAYSYAYVVEECAISKPHNGAYGEEERKREGHEFNTLCLYHTRLLQQKKGLNITLAQNLLKYICVFNKAKRLVTTIIRGAAKTETEIATQIQPRTETWRLGLLTAKCVTIRINEKKATFIVKNNFMAAIYNA